MPEIKGIVFDWGGVIIDEPSAGLQRYCASRLGLSVDAGSAAIAKHLPLYQEGRIEEAVLWQQVCADCGVSFDGRGDSSLWGAAVRAVFRFRQPVLEAIAKLPENGIRVGFLSNTEPEAAAYFHERNMDALFSASVLSCEVRLSKPDAAIYRLVAEQMELPPESCLMLDDRSVNIDGALAAGMHGALVSNADSVLRALADFVP